MSSVSRCRCTRDRRKLLPRCQELADGRVEILAEMNAPKKEAAVSGTVNAAMIGLGFGAEFIPIYKAHPNANVTAICRRNEIELNKVGDQFEIEKRYSNYEDVLTDPEIDFVHINSPIPDHAWMSLKALDAGKHVMCTVPMATTIDECRQIVEKVQATGLKYMMAETVVYSREFLFIKEMYDKGRTRQDTAPGGVASTGHGRLAELLGRDDTHALRDPRCQSVSWASCNGLAEYVSCFGSGTVRNDITEKSGNSFAVESCHIKIKDSDLTAHIWRFLYDVARQYRESFDVYGTKKSFEWTLVENEPHVHPHRQEAGAGNSREGRSAGLRPASA